MNTINATVTAVLSKPRKEYEFEHRLCGHRDAETGINKSIDARIKHKNIKYIVKSQKEQVLKTGSLGSAIKAYNAI